MSVPAIGSHFGGKAAIAHLYPWPQRDLIIEPFAGGAAYTLLHWSRRVWINDIDPEVYGRWRFLTDPTSAARWERYVPDRFDVIAGQPTDEVLAGLPDDIATFLRPFACRGTGGIARANTFITPHAARYWFHIKRRIRPLFAKVGAWRVTNLRYDELPNLDACWFLDSPYRLAGHRYRFGSQQIDYDAYAEWALQRRGHVIACEAQGETYLPFRPLTGYATACRSSYQKRDHAEAIFESCDGPRPDPLSVGATAILEGPLIISGLNDDQMVR